RSGNTATQPSVDFVVGGYITPIGSADAEDFGGVFPSGTLTFVPGKTSKTITIDVVGDTVVEPDEMFWVGLLHPSLGAAIPIRNQSAHVTIRHDDYFDAVYAASANDTLSASVTGAGRFQITINGVIQPN